MKASAHDVILLNNLAFSYASLDEVDKAEAVLNKLKNVDFEEPTIVATLGLIAFRKGDQELGRSLYSKAIDEFKKEQNKKSEANAKFYWAQETARA